MSNRIIMMAMALVPLVAAGQSFRERTNEVVLDYTAPAVRSVLPKIVWTSPAFESTSSQESRITLDAVVTGTTVLKTVVLQVIDGEQNVKEKAFELSAGSYTYRINQSVTLPDGQHTLRVVARNVTGGEVSSSRSVVIGKDAIADALSMTRKDIALMFATDKYDYWPDLVNPVDDAQTIAGELQSRFGFEPEVLTNVSQEDVFNKLADYAQRTYKPQDQLLIFFAGHGYFDDTFGEGFVVATNSLENDRAKTSYISHSRLRSIIDNIPCEHILLVMDVCFGGTFDPKIAQNRGAEPGTTDEREYMVRKLSYKTRRYLTSGGKQYVSDGIPGKHSPFAQRLLQAFKEGGGEDRILTLGELKLQVERLIPEPRSGSFGTDNQASDFLFVGKQN
ncbi:MAG: caspase domain-containing protein [Bacteroidota bacterium]